MRFALSGVGLAAAVLLAAPPAFADEIGCVSTAFKLLGPNHKVCIEAFDDPEVKGVTCHLSRPRTGGLEGMVGLAEDPSDSSIACRQVGPIELPKDLDEGGVVFSERRSPLFKRLRVHRFLDKDRNVLIYLVISDKLVDGSPKSSISSVPIMPWNAR
ncbi:CreA family protein [Pararhodospirillum oryzae]|uniref:Protein CreA n=1 Tax=Pararhodospirillum oryzae TaxID=478448 RepID=A0A512H7Q6_9PROT|nr:CreA family protein [Pararhodospirillum oryzae]GEO81487.1 hypothetical protein ROR02_16180 [Pararhodospirillum oryzae]